MNNIDYHKYIMEQLDKSISYTEYISGQCYNIGYSEYIAEPTKEELLKRKRLEKISIVLDEKEN